MAQWDQLKKISAWTSLADLPYSCIKLEDGLYRIEDGEYIVTVRSNRNFEHTADAPFITLVLWAATDGAAKRAKLGNIEADQVILYSEPPPEMRLAEKARTYADIIVELKTQQYGKFMEYAKYRLSTDGAFIHRVIETKQFKFCFRKLEEDEEEMPYAIFFKLG